MSSAYMADGRTRPGEQPAMSRSGNWMGPASQLVQVGICCYTVHMSSSPGPRSFYLNPSQPISETPLKRLSASDEQALMRRAQAGSKDALAALLQAYEPLVAAQARHVPAIGLGAEDLLQAGRLGLVEAVRRFDPERGTRLATLAGWRVRWAMAEAAARALPLPVPEREHRLQHKIQAVALRLLAERGEMPSALEVAMAAGLAADDVRSRLHGSPTMVSLDVLDVEVLPGDGAADGGDDDQQQDGVELIRHQLAALARRLTGRLGRTPSPAELSAELGLPRRTLEAALRGDRAALVELGQALMPAAAPRASTPASPGLSKAA